jgi:predicted amidophosphoribosyltransferase
MSGCAPEVIQVTSFLRYSSGPFSNAAERRAAAIIWSLKRKGGPSCDLLAWFGEMARLALDVNRVRGQVIVIPIPGSDCVVGSMATPGTLPLAQALVLNMRRAITVDCLRWRTQLAPSHKGGSRDVGQLFKQLTIIAPIEPGTVVLVDDLLTSGAHIVAATRRLRRAGRSCEYAICLGRTASYRRDRVFSIAETLLSDCCP